MGGREVMLRPVEEDGCGGWERLKQKRQKDGLYVMATGGGAYKFYDKIRERLGVEIYREDEMECLIVGQPDTAPFR